MIINFNSICKVQLNDYGKKIWYSYAENSDYPPEVQATLKQKVDIDGWLELELWAIMSIFGPNLSQVSMPFARTTIELHPNPIFGKNS